MEDTIKRATEVSRTLSNLKAADKAINELHRMKSGRFNLVESFLELSESQIELALERALDEYRIVAKELEGLVK